MAKGKQRHNPNKFANNRAGKCPYYEEHPDGFICECYPEIPKNNLKCGGNIHSCIKTLYQKHAIIKDGQQIFQ